MVNALLWDLPATIYSAEEIDLLIGYIHQIHFLHGFETVFLSEDTYRKLKTVIPPENDYVKRLPKRRKGDDKLLKKVVEALDSILWSLKRTDHLEAQLGSFVDVYSMWIQASSLKAAVILPMAKPTSSISHFFHILISDQRDFIGSLASDLELWVLSRFADIRIQWPYYLDFSNQTKEMLQGCFDFDQFKVLRTDICKYPVYKGLRKKRKKWLSKALKFVESTLEYAVKHHRDKIILTRSAIGVSDKNALAFKELEWHHPDLMQILEEPILNNKVSVSCFIPDKLYVSEFIKKMQPYSSLKRPTNPISYYGLFELTCDKEVDLALANFKRRIVRHIS